MWGDRSHGFSGRHMRKDEINEWECTFDSEECIQFINELIKAESLENNAAIGVSKVYLDSGYNYLSEKQKNVFKTVLQQNLLKCGRCEVFLWEEADYIIDNGLCPACQQSWDNSP